MITLTIRRLLVGLPWAMLLVAGCTPGIYQSKPVDGPPAIVPVGLVNLPDAIPRDEVPCSGCARPYVIDGVRYQPLASNLGYREQGNASWYGTAFHGNPTATGERYDMFAMTAAHKTLPIPSYASVRNLQNGRQVTVKVNDRGPFRAGRIIDLSYAAAVKLGIDQIGSAPVEVVALPVMPGSVQGSSKPATGLPGTAIDGFYYQAGAFADPQNARALQVKLLAAGVEPVEIIGVEVSGRRLHRVRVGPVTKEIETLMFARLRDLGLYSPVKDTP